MLYIAAMFLYTPIQDTKERCMKLPKRAKDITGFTFGSLTAVKPIEQDSKGNIYWEYKCVCGNTHIARSNVVTYHTKKSKSSDFPSCGCKQVESVTKHGLRKVHDTHPLYKIYKGIKERCYCETSPSYRWYGAQGVTMCKEWLEDVTTFVEWGLANGWKEGLHIDKDILCTEHGISPHVYSPSTCTWVSPKENVGFSTNRANHGKHPNVKLSQGDVNTILSLYYSKQHNGVELAAMYNVDPSSIYRLIRLDKARSKGNALD